VELHDSNVSQHHYTIAGGGNGPEKGMRCDVEAVIGLLLLLLLAAAITSTTTTAAAAAIL